MRPLPPADELADIRAQIARLRQREAELSAALPGDLAAPLLRSRPGWPIRRQPLGADPPPLARH